MGSPVTWEIGLGHCQMAAGKKHWRLTLDSWEKGARSSVLPLHPGKPHLLKIAIQTLRSGLLFATPWTAICQASPSITISLSLLKLVSIESVMPYNRLILCGPLLLWPSVLSIRSFPMSPLFISGGQSIGASASPPVLPMNIQGWFPLGLAGLITFQSKGLSRLFSSTIVWKHSLVLSLLYGPTLTSVLEKR